MESQSAIMVNEEEGDEAYSNEKSLIPATVAKSQSLATQDIAGIFGKKHSR